MKLITLLLLIMCTVTIFAKKSGKLTHSNALESSKIYQFKLKDIEGEEFDFSQFKDNVILIVNVASKCGFTNQYEGLQKLYQGYKDQGFVVIGIPSNDFGKQEPGSAADIQSFCSMNYNVTFPILEKSRVKGKNAIPLYRFLTDKKLHPTTGGQVSWNFNKFLVDKNGYVIDRFSSFTKPESKKVITAIEKSLSL